MCKKYMYCSKVVLLVWILFVIIYNEILVCLYYTVLSVPCSLVITCWESADLLALFVCEFPCVLSLFNMISRVRCGTLLYRFLVFTLLFICIIQQTLYMILLLFILFCYCPHWLNRNYLCQFLKFRIIRPRMYIEDLL